MKAGPLQITVEELVERDFNQSGISNAKLVEGICTKCGKPFEYSRVKKFMRNRSRKPDKRSLWVTCQGCWLVINTAEDASWVETNRLNQLKIQSTPQQKAKNAAGVSASYTPQMRKRASERLKDKWSNVEFASSALANISWTQTNDERFDAIMRKSFGSGGLRGDFNGMRYESAVELSFLLWCNKVNVPVKRYDLPPIQYEDECGIQRVYIPDFIINGNTVVEIKGRGLYFRRNFKRNEFKLAALKLWCEQHSLKYVVIMDNDSIIQKNYRRARRLHHANKSKAASAV